MDGFFMKEAIKYSKFILSTCSASEIKIEWLISQVLIEIR